MRYFPSTRSAIFGSLLLCAVPIPGWAQSPSPEINPEQIVRSASWNELHRQGPPRPVRYQLYKEDSKGSTLREIVETSDGEVARLIEKDGRALTADEAQAELDRLQHLFDDPEIQARRHKSEQEDSSHGDELVKMLPDAFLYTYEGMTQGPSGPCYRLSFKPNPSFVPPDKEGALFHGMVGELWVDQGQLRLTRIDAHLISDVDFGWGVFGRLYKGGSILVEDADVGMHHWETTQMKLDLHGKVLLVKNVDFSTTERASNFQPVPVSTTYKDAIRMLTRPGEVQGAEMAGR
jgi:hypothetical protein